MAAIILLGLRQESADDAREMDVRCHKAVQVYRETDCAKIIACGGKTGFDTRTEAKVMRDRLVELGVNASDIALETGSQTTMENLRNAGALCLAAGEEELIIVTSDYHIRRTKRIAKRLELNARVEGTKIPFTPEKARKRFMELLYTLDLLLGFEDPGAHRPRWAQLAMRLFCPNKNQSL